MTGKIKRLVADRNFGFIQADGGQDVFFHASSVQQRAFADLSVGQVVNFDLERGDKGPKAANVRASTEQTLS